MVFIIFYNNKCQKRPLEMSLVWQLIGNCFFLSCQTLSAIPREPWLVFTFVKISFLPFKFDQERMFSMFPKRVLSGHSNIAKSLQLPRFNSMLQTKNRAKGKKDITSIFLRNGQFVNNTKNSFPEFQKVNLLGTIYQEPTTFKDGSKGISVKTVQSDSF